ncbi:putative leader peptide [Jatrophihabitans sp.]
MWDHRVMAPEAMMLTSRRHIDLLRVVTAAC